MSEIVTSQTILAEITPVRAAMYAAAERLKESEASFPRAELDHENSYSNAFIRFKEAGATDALAREKAKLASADERLRYLELKEAKSNAKAELRACTSLVEAYRSLSYTASTEMKLSDG